ncbi:MAG: hypothetical protein F6K14_28160 [Symploca sp. SIO2C1]|nr:hypothetical protein [Symploca sp. SIO2C1]
MNTLIDSDIRQTSLAEQKLYDHLLDCVKNEPPEQMIERFKSLFLEGSRYADPHIWSALETLISGKQAEEEFQFFLNRCCHILINRWQLQPDFQGAIPQLVGLFENLDAYRMAYSRGARRLRQLVQLFIQTEQYLTLRRLSQVMDEIPPEESSNSQAVGALIQRYPYLYEHCLLSEDSSYEHQQTVRQIRARIQQRFELDLAGYVTYQVRCDQAKRRQPQAAPEKIIHPVKNPTLLSDDEFRNAVREFVGKVQGCYTYRDIAQSFLTHSSRTSLYKYFKDDLYEYLTASIDSSYGKRYFNDRLYKQLKNTLTLSDHKQLNEFLIVRTCSQLLNFLVVESSHQPNHYIFVDLITNLGATSTTGILLKVVLLCSKVKPSLEKRFSILFNHYESANRDGVPWLIRSLENVNVALSVHFGGADLSCLNLYEYDELNNQLLTE